VSQIQPGSSGKHFEPPEIIESSLFDPLCDPVKRLETLLIGGECLHLPVTGVNIEQVRIPGSFLNFDYFSFSSRKGYFLAIFEVRSLGHGWEFSSSADYFSLIIGQNMKILPLNADHNTLLSRVVCDSVSRRVIIFS